MQARGDSLCTRVFTLGELLTGPYKRGATELAAQIREVLQPPTVQLLPFAADAADLYARIRSNTQVRPADAIHLASAAQARVNLFLTNDLQLPKLAIPGIDFIAGMDVALF